MVKKGDQVLILTNFNTIKENIKGVIGIVYETKIFDDRTYRLELDFDLSYDFNLSSCFICLHDTEFISLNKLKLNKLLK